MPSVERLEPEKTEFQPREVIKEITYDQPRYPYEKVQDFRHELERQISGLARIENEAINCTERNPHISQDELLGFFATQSADLKLPSEWSLIAGNLIDSFVKRNDAVVGMYEKYKGDAKAIYQETFNTPPVGNVEVRLGPALLYFRCDNDADYALIYSQKFVTGGAVTPADMKQALESDGVSISSALKPDMRGSIIAERACGRNFYEPRSQEIYEHEKRHALNSFFIKYNRSYTNLVGY